jgi:outer membrane protein OmpA-like peptidoglycan-associated protein/opacity protein-like surface antigen
MRKLAIAVALSSTLLATPAFARDGAWYVGGEFGAMIVEDIDVDIGANQNALSLDHDYGYDGGLFVGYDLGGFRIEGEVAYKKADIKGFETTIALPGQNSATFAKNGAAQGDVSALSFMLNAMLDFGDDDGITGFVGGGAGMARVNMDGPLLFSTGTSPVAVDDSDSRFAWQAIAGVRQAISDNIDITVKYRFFNVDNLRMIAFNGQQTNARLRTHSLMGGLTFNFGAPVAPVVELPPPPPAPVPPPPPAPTPPPPPPPCVAGPFMVFFDWDRDEVTPQAAAILDNAASAYQTCGQAQVMIAGHADRSGSDQYNVGLSQRRTGNVRSYLAGRGIPEGVMTTEAFGESRPLVETADGVREPQNRRVEITYGPGSGW